jgi:hypothetical protein
MITPGSANPLLFSADEGYNLTRSLRFRSSASAYLNRTPATTTNRRTWTVSCWVKRGRLATGTEQVIFSSNNGSTFTELNYLASSDVLRLNLSAGGSAYYFDTSAVFRDPSAWYHIVVAVDTTQATATDRMKVYINGVQQVGTNNSPAQNYDTDWNRAQNAFIGSRTASTWFNDFYLAEFNNIDGLQLTPSSFGSTNALTGVWQPARYTGTYGTNGFYLPFTDNSALTTSSNVGLGRDYSGNGNYWTTNNISITAGVTYDSMTDVPTLTSATAANFAVMNPLDMGASVVPAYANLRVGTASAIWRTIRSTMQIPTTGKWYSELTVETSSRAIAFGISTASQDLANYTGSGSAGWSYYSSTGEKLNAGTGVAYGSAWDTAGTVIGLAFDAAAGTLVFYKNNTSQGTAYSGLTAGNYFISASPNNCNVDINFGQRPFAYTPPTGFVALNTFNLPTSTIVKGNTVMDATLYTGNATARSITNAAPFQPDLVWIKSRSNADNHNVFDTLRIVSSDAKRLYSNLTNAEESSTFGGATNLTTFNSNGFSLGTGTDTNRSAGTFVAWQWQAGQGTSSSNTNGTITSTVSVNASAGFSVVTYTGTGANATVGHGLGVAPQMILFKRRNTAADWVVYNSSVGNTSALFLNSIVAASANSVYFNNTSPTSTVFSVGTAVGVNNTSDTYVAYCWTPIAGYSAFGSYTGNGSTNGPFVYTGFRPKFVMVKNTTDLGSWITSDTARGTYNLNDPYLVANSSDAEVAGNFIDILSNGFKFRATSGTGINGSGQTYIYMAFAETPTKFSLAR